MCAKVQVISTYWQAHGETLKTLGEAVNPAISTYRVGRRQWPLMSVMSKAKRLLKESVSPPKETLTSFSALLP